MILAIGEILYDIFPKYRCIGGAPFNFAYHLKNLGFDIHFISRTGRDEPGESILSYIENSGFDPGDIQIDNQHDTGRVIVKLDDKGIPNFNIIPDAAYDYIALDEKLLNLLNLGPDLIYFGSLIQRTKHGFNELHSILDKKHEKTRCFYDMNLRPGCYKPSIIRSSLEKADILKLNDDELATAGELLEIKQTGHDLVKEIMNIFNISTIALTLGARGSALYIDQNYYKAEPRKAKKIIDTVGAGDAYAAILAEGILRFRKPEILIDRAARLSAKICGIKGALPLENNFYEDFK
ncbi:Carbohydrate kinase, PfkB family [Desulfonema limicola]|uniref:Carbohydrate kinase, PfkB family n=1 Tax=Desulfonema limicola TaxID=45656 RepID=A0A975BAZ2_9BACT|nr:PfkB family carbohydrate kinase [Desulfonema limicola]QTA82011.1 Carbohydrate kinase, PfkB family [Desulfonema limicola]